MALMAIFMFLNYVTSTTVIYWWYDYSVWSGVCRLTRNTCQCDWLGIDRENGRWDFVNVGMPLAGSDTHTYRYGWNFSKAAWRVRPYGYERKITSIIIPLFRREDRHEAFPLACRIIEWRLDRLQKNIKVARQTGRCSFDGLAWWPAIMKWMDATAGAQ